MHIQEQLNTEKLNENIGVLFSAYAAARKELVTLRFDNKELKDQNYKHQARIIELETELKKGK